MSIGFNEIPAGIRVPFFYVEFDNSRASSSAAQFKTLLIGQKLTTGAADPETRLDVTSEAQAILDFGTGSQIARMVSSFRKTNPLGQCEAIALDDNAAGVASTGSVTITGAATANGILSVVIAGDLIQAGVSNADTASDIGDALAAAINAKTTLGVTASNASGVVTITARNKGEAGNDNLIVLNKFSGNITPAGLSVALAQMSGGAGNPDFADALAAMGDDQFQVISAPYYDASNLTKIAEEMARRWGPLVMGGGIYISSLNKNFSDAKAIGSAQNSPFISLPNIYGTPTPSDEIAANVAGLVAAAAEIDPARPFQTLKLSGVMGPDKNTRFTTLENDGLLKNGIATLAFNDAGEIRIQRMISTYQTNAAGSPDVSYLDINTPLTLEFIRQDFKNYMAGKYPRYKLAGDKANFGAGQPVMTPKLGAAEAMKKFRDWETAALVEDGDQFKKDLIVEIDANNPNRLNFLLVPNLVNQFRVGGVKVQFLL